MALWWLSRPLVAATATFLGLDTALSPTQSLREHSTNELFDGATRGMFGGSLAYLFYPMMATPLLCLVPLTTVSYYYYQRQDQIKF